MDKKPQSPPTGPTKRPQSNMEHKTDSSGSLASEGSKQQPVPAASLANEAAANKAVEAVDTKLGRNAKLPIKEQVAVSEKSEHHSNLAAPAPSTMRKGRRLEQNVSSFARILSTGVGTIALVYGLRQMRSMKGLLSGIAGSMLVARGVSGHCFLYKALDVDTSPDGLAKGKGLLDPHPYELKRSLTIWRPRNEVYNKFRDFTYISKIIPNIRKVEKFSEHTYQLVYANEKGKSFPIDLEILNEQEMELVSWTLAPEGKKLLKAVIKFKDGPKESSTELHTELVLTPPAGAIGTAVMKIFGPFNQQILNSSLLKLKQFIETGEVATIRGQSSGKKASNLSEIPQRVVEFIENLRTKSERTKVEQQEAS